jgi:hypothetical protein
MSEKRKLKRVVIQEELVALTGDHINALILKQFLYWGERVRDFDKFIAEEKERDPGVKVELTHGWIYKSAEELADELMINLSSRTVARRIEGVIKAGWLDRRRNPHHAWDRTWQYRPNLRNIQAGLQDLSYALEGYPLLPDVQCIGQNDQSNGQGDQSNGQGDQSNGQGDQSNGQGDEALPEITPEITSGITSEITLESGELWEKALEDLQVQMTKPTFDTWLKNSRGVCLDDHILTVGVRTQAAVEWCTHRLRKIVERTLIGVVGGKVGVKFEVM